MPIRQTKLAQEIVRVENEFFRTVATLIVSAFGVVAALAWNTAITKILERYLSLRPESTVVSWLVYAVIVTIIAVIVTVYLGGLAKRYQARIDDLKKETK